MLKGTEWKKILANATSPQGRQKYSFISAQHHISDHFTYNVLLFLTFYKLNEWFTNNNNKTKHAYVQFFYSQ